jgi:hypothetical protein
MRLASKKEPLRSPILLPLCAEQRKISPSPVALPVLTCDMIRGQAWSGQGGGWRRRSPRARNQVSVESRSPKWAVKLRRSSMAPGGLGEALGGFEIGETVSA